MAKSMSVFSEYKPLHKAGSLNFGTTDTESQLILHCRGLMHGKLLSSIPDLCQLDDSNITQLEQPKISPDIVKCQVVKNHWC